MYLHNSLSPVTHAYFCSKRENKKQPWGKIVQNVSYGEGQSVESENTHVKMGTSSFKIKGSQLYRPILGCEGLGVMVIR